MAIFSAPNTLGLEDWQLAFRDATAGYVVYPTPDNGELRVNIGFAMEAEEFPRHDLAAQKALIAARCADIGGPIPALLTQLATADDIYFGPLAQVRMSAWTRGRIALIGDAAHCPTPFTGQGTSLALVSAFVLARELARSPGDHAAAFARYEARVRPFALANQDMLDLGRQGPTPDDIFDRAKNAISLGDLLEGLRQKESVFFFEKKNQKLFDTWLRRGFIFQISQIRHGRACSGHPAATPCRGRGEAPPYGDGFAQDRSLSGTPHPLGYGTIGLDTICYYFLCIFLLQRFCGARICQIVIVSVMQETPMPRPGPFTQIVQMLSALLGGVWGRLFLGRKESTRLRQIAEMMAAFDRLYAQWKDGTVVPEPEVVWVEPREDKRTGRVRTRRSPARRKPAKPEARRRIIRLRPVNWAVIPRKIESRRKRRTITVARADEWSG